MKINWEWSGKRATRLGILLLAGADVYYFFLISIFTLFVLLFLHLGLGVM